MDADVVRQFYHVNRNTLSSQEQEQLKDTLETEAAKDDPEGIFLLGRLYYEGFCVKQDYTKARHLFKKASKAGHDWSTVYLGYCYYYGRQIPVNYAKAWKAFSTAAKNNNHCALYKMGDMYRDGLYVTRNTTQALTYYQRAIHLIDPTIPEYPNIAARIGHCQAMGLGCPKDELKALQWLHTAQEGCYALLTKGDPYAHLSLPQIEADIQKTVLSLHKKLIKNAYNVQYT